MDFNVKKKNSEFTAGIRGDSPTGNFFYLQLWLPQILLPMLQAFTLFSLQG
jgi:hypothetical protein